MSLLRVYYVSRKSMGPRPPRTSPAELCCPSWDHYPHTTWSTQAVVSPSLAVLKNKILDLEGLVWRRSGVKVTQSRLTLCVLLHGILQARTLEWAAFPSPGYLLNPGIKPRSPTLQADSLPAEPQGKPQCREGNIKSLIHILRF